MEGFFIVYRKQLISSVLTMVTLVFFYAAFGFYFESSERWLAPVIHGDLTSSPYGIWFTDNHFLQMPILSYVASLFPSLPVYGMWHMGFMMLFIWLWFFLCIRLISRRTKSLSWQIAIVIPFVWSILGMSLVYVYFMRGSILLASVSILLYLDYFIEGKRKPVFILFFLFGCGMRVSSALLVLGLITLFAAFNMRKKVDVFKALWLPWLLASICMTAIVLNRIYSDNQGIKIEQGVEYALLDRQAINPISIMNTPEDTIRYRALTEHGIISDSAQITFKFISRLIDHDKLNITGINKADVNHFYEAFIPWFDLYKWVLILLYASLLILVYTQPRHIVLKLCLIHVSGWGVLMLIGMKISMYNYFLEPWLAVLFGMSYFLLLGREKGEILVWQKVLVVFFPVMVCVNLWATLRTISAEEKDRNRQTQANLHYLDKISQTEIPLIWINLLDQHLLPSDIFSRDETKIFRKSEYLCMSFWSYYPFAQDRCQQRLGFSPLDWRGMHRELHVRKDQVCFLMNEQLAVFLPEYYQVLYGLDFEVRRDYSQPEVLPGVFVYKLL